ncbi:MAG: hypothetical protein Hals2KO_08570 [Halioglobus sp.]
MNDTVQDIVHNPGALLPKRHIFLLSHMRAYSSLLGHIFGSNPAICGYYEMHIGYHSWKSLLRQKLLYFRDEPPKPGYKSMFDKVLHNDHAVAANILNHPRVSVIFALRPPQQTVPSIVKLYRSTDPTHDFSDATFSAHYYIRRLQELERLASQCRQDFFYLDAEALKEAPDTALAALTSWLQLKEPLSPDYQLQSKTSAQRYGDSSAALRSGHIETRASRYDTAEIAPELLREATETFQNVRATLAGSSAVSILAGDKNQ